VREPKTFDVSDASSVVSSVTVEYKKRPFGVLAYVPWWPWFLEEGILDDLSPFKQGEVS
jgi:hypothetical protein